MKFQLKNVKFYESMSEETNAFTADLFIDGKKICYVKNDGHGGCTDYNVYDFKDVEVLKKAEEYCKTLPKKHVEKFDFTYQPTVESEIDDLFTDWLEAKEQKKLEANMKKGVLVGSPEYYSIISWKGMTLEAILNTKNPSYIGALKKVIADQKAKGATILNTNIPEEYLN